MFLIVRFEELRAQSSQLEVDVVVVVLVDESSLLGLRMLLEFDPVVDTLNTICVKPCGFL